MIDARVSFIQVLALYWAARADALFDKVSEDIQDRGIALMHEDRAFLPYACDLTIFACFDRRNRLAGAAARDGSPQRYFPLRTV